MNNGRPKPDTNRLLAKLRIAFADDPEIVALVETLACSALQQDIFLKKFIEMFSPRVYEEDDHA